MKKTFLGLALVALASSGSVLAQQENAGGVDAGQFAVGGVKISVVGAGVTAAAIALAMSANSGGSASEVDLIPPVINPPPVEPPVEPPTPSCNEGDTLVDGVCFNVSITQTVTVIGTGTATGLVNVPVTVTYVPS